VRTTLLKSEPKIVVHPCSQIRRNDAQSADRNWLRAIAHLNFQPFLEAESATR
jgi:hypothetical protein